MDDIEIKHLQDELIELFGKFQNVVDDFAINRLANKCKRKSREGPLIETEWSDEYWRIERSPEFINLAGHFEYYRRLFVREDDGDLLYLFNSRGVRPIAPGEFYAGGMASEKWRELNPPCGDGWHQSEGEHTSEVTFAFGLWCVLSGFYYRKLAKFDLYDWSRDFVQLLKRMPTEIGQVRIVLGFGELPDYIKFETHELNDLDKSLERTIECLKQSDFREYSFERFAGRRTVNGEEQTELFVSFDELKPSRDYSGKIIERRVHMNLLTSNEPVPLFNKERAIFQVCYDEKCQLQFSGFVSATLLEPICQIWELNPSGQPHLPKQEESRRLEMAIASVDSDTAHIDNDQTWIGRIFDHMVGMIQRGLFGSYGLGNSLSLFELACRTTNRTTEYILYTATLESVFTDRSRDNIGDRICDRFARMVAKNHIELEWFSTELKQIYQRRNDIVHGRDIESIEEPFSMKTATIWCDESQQVLLLSSYGRTIRHICRRSILSFALVIDRLVIDNLNKDSRQSSKCDLYTFLIANSRKACEVLQSGIPNNAQQIRACMAKFEDDDDFWRAFQSTVDTEICGLGYTTIDIFDDSLILKEE